MASPMTATITPPWGLNLRKSYRAQWWLVFVALSLPLWWLAYLAFSGGLGANPIEAINRFFGDWALRTLLIALAATPAKIVFGWVWPVRMRRMIGLWAFAYVALHLSNYIVIDQFFDFSEIWKDIVKRKFITVGMIAFVILSMLAATSWNGAIKRMGAKAWKRLHKLVYMAGALGCLHYIWMVKADTFDPLVHLGILALLLGVRAVHLGRKMWA